MGGGRLPARPEYEYWEADVAFVHKLVGMPSRKGNMQGPELVVGLPP
jgi:hypothetical protein